MTTIPERWTELARYDLETARVMFDAGRWLYVLFCGQQAVEKMLKGIIAQRTQEVPPRLHNLMRLAEHAGLDPDSVRATALRQLTAYYVESRYPEELDSLSRSATRELAQEVLAQTGEVLQWLESPIR